MRKWIGVSIALFLFCASPHARGYITPAVVWEPPAYAGEQFLLEIGYGFCDLVQVFDVQDREVERDGATIRVTVRGTWTDDFPECIVPPSVVRVSVGPLIAGSYRVELYSRFIGVPSVVRAGPVSQITVTPRQGVGAEPIPALSTAGFGALAALLATLGLLAVRRHAKHLSH